MLPHKRGQASLEYLALIAFVLLLVALSVVLLREGLLVSANQQIQSALNVQRQVTNATGAITPVRAPTRPEPSRTAGGLLEVLGVQINNYANLGYQTLGAWAGYAWLVTALGLGALIAFGLYRVLRGR